MWVCWTDRLSSTVAVSRWKIVSRCLLICRSPNLFSSRSNDFSRRVKVADLRHQWFIDWDERDGRCSFSSRSDRWSSSRLQWMGFQLWTRRCRRPHCSVHTRTSLERLFFIEWSLRSKRWTAHLEDLHQCQWRETRRTTTTTTKDQQRSLFDRFPSLDQERRSDEWSWGYCARSLALQSARESSGERKDAVSPGEQCRSEWRD